MKKAINGQRIKDGKRLKKRIKEKLTLIGNKCLESSVLKESTMVKKHSTERKSAYPGKKKKLRQKKKKCPELDTVISAAELAVHLTTFKPISWYYKL